MKEEGPLAGGICGYDMGLGKTALALATVVLSSTLNFYTDPPSFLRPVTKSRPTLGMS